MAKIKVTKVKSTIEKDERQKRTIQALGLGKIGTSNVLEKHSGCGRYGAQGAAPDKSGKRISEPDYFN
jgi:ribosomal protein L30/L7E